MLNQLSRACGKVIGCCVVPIKVEGIGQIPFEAPVLLAAGETLEYWLVVDGERQFYRSKLHPLGCRCGGACRS